MDWQKKSNNPSIHSYTRSNMEIIKDKSLAEFTSFRVGGSAEQLCILETPNDLKQIDFSQTEHCWILGEGSNSVISDKGLPGLTIIMKNGGITSDDSTLTVQAGTDWDYLVQFSIKNHLWGIELMSGIPGSVGAGIAGNIAAYGQAVSDVLVSIEAFNMDTRQTEVLTTDQLDFGYRTSKFKQPEFNNIIIISATFELSPTKTSGLHYQSAKNIAEEHDLDHDNLEHRREIILKARAKAGSLLDESALNTAGSFYKNPVVAPEVAEHVLSFEESSTTKEQILKSNKVHGGDTMRIPAALVLLAAGFKRGQTWDQVQLHPDHILKIVNIGNAKAQEIYNVHLLITSTVKEKLGITLEPEVQFLGEF